MVKRVLFVVLGVVFTAVLVSYIRGEGLPFVAVLQSSPKSTAVPVCKPGEGYICPWKTDVPGISYTSTITCQAPIWLWNKQILKWEQAKNLTACPPEKGKLCSSFNYEDLAWHNAAARKWPPEQFGPNYLPLYPEGTPYKKYNQFIPELADCNPNVGSVYMGIPRSNFEPDCRKVPSEDSEIWLLKGAADYAIHQLKWKQCDSPAGPGPGSLVTPPTTLPSSKEKDARSSPDKDVIAQIEATMKSTKLRLSEKLCLKTQLKHATRVDITGIEENLEQILAALESNTFSVKQCRELAKTLRK